MSKTRQPILHTNNFNLCNQQYATQLRQLYLQASKRGIYDSNNVQRFFHESCAFFISFKGVSGLPRVDDLPPLDRFANAGIHRNKRSCWIFKRKTASVWFGCLPTTTSSEPFPFAVTTPRQSLSSFAKRPPPSGPYSH